MKKIYFLLLLVVCSCGPTALLKRSKALEELAIKRGAKISRDTVYKEIEKKVLVPGDTVYKTVTPVIDVPSFDVTMFGNDSLVLVIDSLTDRLKSGQDIHPEKTMSALRGANDQIRALKKRLAQGFSKDSTYTYVADSVTTIWVTTKDGLVSAVGYDRKRTELAWKEKLPIYIDQKVKAGFTVVELIGGIVFGLVVGALILGIVIAIRGRDDDHV